ncbi:MAG TPA: hypothetical protein DDZ81_21575 [Acetobacteraceae bacterium]|jgi:hypothetical protein|nr:hypothetical protein [Acetobacteraceae bacterium]
MNPRRAFRFVENALATIMDLWAKPSTPSQTALARRLVGDLDALMQAGRTGEGSDFWQGICVELHRLAASGDPMYFMRWPAIEATMVHGAAPVTLRMWLMLRQSPAWRTLWAPALRHPRFGHPPPFAPMPSTDAIALEHASHLFRFHRQQATHFHDADCIIEFGGGYGSMCRMTRALGFRGKYIIFDLPPVSALQRYYLGMHGIEADGTGGAATWLCNDLDAITAWLERDAPSGVSLISTWALSEMPMFVRRRIEPFFSLPVARKALLAYQPEFEGTDNKAYFRDMMGRTSDRWVWSELNVDPSGKTPTAADSLYVFGVAP